MVTSEIGRSSRGRDGTIVSTITLSENALAFTFAVLFMSIFTSTAWGHPGQRLPPREAIEDPAGTTLTSCGEVTTASRGVLQTPGFPNAFPVPLRCTWVIDASSGHAPGSSILVRLTQVFVAGGLRFESFSRLDVTAVSEGRPRWFVGRQRGGKIPSEGRQLIFDSDFGSSPPLEEVAWIRTTSPYLVATLSIDSLEGSHIRDLGVLLDVYGLNMTYQVMAPPKSDSGSARVRGRQRGGVKGRRKGGKGGGLDGGCSLLGCSVAGHCLANHDLSRYHCSCFEGHFGRRCQYSRECNPMKNISRCHNGGKCRHVGSTAIRCECPKGFYGPLCEDRHPAFGGLNPESRDLGSGSGKRTRQRKKMKGSGKISGTKDCLGFQCKYDGSPESTCKCQPRYEVHKGDRWLIDGTFKIANFTVRPKQPNGTIEELLEKQLARYLRRQNMSHESSISIGKVSEDGEVSYSFAVGEDDGPRARGALDVIVREIQLLGEFHLFPDSLKVHQGPALLLLEVALDTSSVAPGGGYTASCVAQGSPAMEFRWYKDGYLIDHTKASRYMWQRLLPDDRPNTYTAILRVTAASAPEDMGVLWCHISDRGRQQCGHVIVAEARGPSQGTYVRPRASTVLRGGNLTMACTPPASVIGGGVDRDAEFSWSKNGTPLRVSPGKEVVESLYPSGSLLRIYNAQQSAMYTCHVVTNVSSQQSTLPSKSPNVLLSEEGENGVSSHVAVTDPEDPVCPQETSWGVEWPYTAVGQRAAVECPMAHSSSPPATPNSNINASIFHSAWGHTPVGNAWLTFYGPEATRLCSGAAKWELPDFSHCDCQPITNLQKKFHRMTLGYMATSPEQTLQELLDWLMSGGPWNTSKDGPSSDSPSVPLGSQSPQSSIILPGQIKQILHLLEEIQYYLYDRTVVDGNYHGGIDMDMSSYNLLKVLDLLLLEHQHSVSDPEVSTRLIHLAHQQSILWAHTLDRKFLGSHIKYPTSSSNVTPSDSTTTISASLFVFIESKADGIVRIPMPSLSIPLWLSEQVEVSLFTGSPSLVDVLLQPNETTTGGVLGIMSTEPKATPFTTAQSSKDLFFCIIAFRNIGTSFPVKNKNSDSGDHLMEYQLASPVVSIGLYHQHGQKRQQSFMKSSYKNGQDLREWYTSMRAEGPLNLTIHFFIEPQGIANKFQNGLKSQVACGHLSDRQMLTTSEVNSSWDVGPALSSNGSVVTCHFENSGTYAAFLIGENLRNPTSLISSTDVELEGRASRGDEWWKILNGNHGSGSKAILGISFSICFALCLLTVLKNAIDMTSCWRKVPRNTSEDLPSVGRPSFSEQPVNDGGSLHSNIVKSKEVAAKSEGWSIPVVFYLHMQCCITNLITMGLFSYGCLFLSSKSSQPYVTLGLEISLLTGMASLMGIVLLLYFEISAESRVTNLVPTTSAARISMICVGSRGVRRGITEASSITPSKKNSLLKVCWVSCCKINKFQKLPHAKLIIAGISSGVPMLSVFVLDLIQRTCSLRILPSWWLTIESSHFGIFLSLAIIISLLFLPVSADMLRQMYSSKSLKEGLVEGVVREKETEEKSITSMRMEVLRRAVAVFSTLALMEIASIIYINSPDSSAAQLIFSISCLLLGVIIFLSYAVKFDEPRKLCSSQLLPLLSLGRGGRLAWGDQILCYQWLRSRRQMEGHV